ncbi:MAG: NirD/YgiW/YdeI family stress tolerance protein [Leptolyngbyaceae cyanobacterium MO_188.B28]|nr:NirD/YgiW/YdeI family stress tolerance protein [Leptolyngbyaceae cyanobacterium MO_188.B28]
MVNFKADTIQRTDSSSNGQHSFFSKSALSLGIAMLGVVTLSTAALGEQTQSSTETAATVASILANPVDGATITLRGEILRPGDDDEEYVFSDGTGEITLEIYDEDFELAPDMPIEISGEIDLESADHSQHEEHAEEVEINVYQWQAITPEF